MNQGSRGRWEKENERYDKKTYSMKCPNCDNDFEPKTGRRPKRFCSDECRIAFHNGQKTRGYVKRATYELVLKENKELKDQIVVLSQNKPILAPQVLGKPKPSKRKDKVVMEEKTGSGDKGRNP